MRGSLRVLPAIWRPPCSGSSRPSRQHPEPASSTPRGVSCRTRRSRDRAVRTDAESGGTPAWNRPRLPPPQRPRSIPPGKPAQPNPPAPPSPSSGRREAPPRPTARPDPRRHRSAPSPDRRESGGTRARGSAAQAPGGRCAHAAPSSRRPGRQGAGCRWTPRRSGETPGWPGI